MYGLNGVELLLDGRGCCYSKSLAQKSANLLRWFIFITACIMLLSCAARPSVENKNTSAVSRDMAPRLLLSASTPQIDTQHNDEINEYEHAREIGTLEAYSRFLAKHHDGRYARAAISDIWRLIIIRFPDSIYNINVRSPNALGPYFPHGDTLLNAIIDKFPFIVMAVPKAVKNGSCIRIPAQFVELAGSPLDLARVVPSYMQADEEYSIGGNYYSNAIRPIHIAPYGTARFDGCVTRFVGHPLPANTVFKVSFGTRDGISSTGNKIFYAPLLKESVILQ